MAEREEQAAGPNCTEIAELLPVYLNRSLDQDTARRVEAHLAGCAACRQEERDARTARDLFAAHLPVELLLDYALAQPMTARRRAVVESHLAACRRCSEEVATVRRQPAATGQDASGAAVAGAPVPADRALGRPRPAGQVGLGRWRALAWAACLAAVIASGGWIWTWQQLVEARARSSARAARAVAVVELRPAAQAGLRQRLDDPRAAANRVELGDDAGELVLVLLSGGRWCEPGCVLGIDGVDGAGPARPGRRVPGLLPSADGHVTVAVPSDWLPRGRRVLTVRDPATDEPVAEYVVEVRHSTGAR